MTSWCYLFTEAHTNYSQGALVIPLHQISLDHPFLHVFQGNPFVLSFLEYPEVLVNHGDQEDQHYMSRGLGFLYKCIKITLKQLHNTLKILPFFFSVCVVHKLFYLIMAFKGVKRISTFSQCWVSVAWYDCWFRSCCNVNRHLTIHFDGPDPTSYHKLLLANIGLRCWSDKGHIFKLLLARHTYLPFSPFSPFLPGRPIWPFAPGSPGIPLSVQITPLKKQIVQLL